MTQPLTEPRNRLVLVVESSTVNGIDFVELKSVDATTLYVHFLNKVRVKTTGIAATISGGDRITGITVNPIDNDKDWITDNHQRPILVLTVNQPGDFSTYTLTLAGPPPPEPDVPLDPMHRSATFSFKVLCPSEFDCAPTTTCCTPAEPPQPVIDYLAKDFQSFKLALTDFSAQRYPAWRERAEADFGVMFMEVLCALADELSYLQDRVAAEATLLGATQRRSLVSMARLVDYEPQPVMSATTLIQCNVVGNTVPAGALVSATRPDGVVVPFEIGKGLRDSHTYPVSPQWNDGIQPYWFDDTQQCLRCGSTGMWLLGHDFGFVTTPPGTALLIQTDLAGESIREIVHVTTTSETWDEVFQTNAGPTPVTYIGWSEQEKLKRDHDLTCTRLAGNLLPATQGQRFSEAFCVGEAPASLSSLPVAIVRQGPNGTDARPNWIIRYPLSKCSQAFTSPLSALAAATEQAQPRLTWLMPGTDLLTGSVIDPEIAKPKPEIAVSRRLPEPESFTFATSLLDDASTKNTYTADPAAWRPVTNNAQNAFMHWEYDGDNGDTLRFGDGTFGASPNDADVFDVEYRVGLGASGNVAADAITNVDRNAAAYLSSVRNPFVVVNGSDEESALHIKRMAPQAFRAVQYRAVRPEDYAAAAEMLPWVLKAGTSFRWTGSWLTVFTVADPKAGGTGGANATEAQQTDLIKLLNRRRLAGYESYAPPPILVSIDLRITVCAIPGWLESDVEAAVLARLADAKQRDGTPGFFYADSFTFGTPLYRSKLESAIQGVGGVRGVLDVQYRQRGASNLFQTLPEVLTFGTGQILRVANDPSYPELGTIRVMAEGGR